MNFFITTRVLEHPGTGRGGARGSGDAEDLVLPDLGAGAAPGASDGGDGRARPRPGLAIPSQSRSAGMESTEGGLNLAIGGSLQDDLRAGAASAAAPHPARLGDDGRACPGLASAISMDSRRAWAGLLDAAEGGLAVGGSHPVGGPCDPAMAPKSVLLRGPGLLRTCLCRSARRSWASTGRMTANARLPPIYS